MYRDKSGGATSVTFQNVKIFSVQYINFLEMSKKPQNCHSCFKKCGYGKVPADTVQQLDKSYEILQLSEHNSYLKRHLTKETLDELKNIRTPKGATLWDCIQSGVINLDSNIGVYAPDPESYTAFESLFNPIIEEYHVGFKSTDKHPKETWGKEKSFNDLDPEGLYIASTRIRCARTIEGYPFNPLMTENQYKQIEAMVSRVLSGLTGSLSGTYYPLTGMTKTVQQKLTDDHFLFKEGDRFLQAANANRFWPIGRGIFHNEHKTFLVWVNEEDHLRIISMQPGGNLGEVYSRLVTGVKYLEKKITMVRSDRLGFLTFCPTNLGTTIRASVHIKLPKLSSNLQELEDVAARYNLQVRGTSGEHSEAKEGIYDISNKRRLGLTEFDAVKEMYDGIQAMINLEKTAA